MPLFLKAPFKQKIGPLRQNGLSRTVLETVRGQAGLLGMIKRVEMVTKEEGACEVALLPQVPFYNLVLTTHTFPPVEIACDIIRPKRAKSAS